MDKNKDGYITKGELKLAKKNIGMKVNISCFDDSRMIQIVLLYFLIIDNIKYT